MRSRSACASRASAQERAASCPASGLTSWNSQDAVHEFSPYFDGAPVHGHRPSLEDFTDQTPLAIGSPQQVIEKTLTFREYADHYQRQLFLGSRRRQARAIRCTSLAPGCTLHEREQGEESAAWHRAGGV